MIIIAHLALGIFTNFLANGTVMRQIVFRDRSRLLRRLSSAVTTSTTLRLLQKISARLFLVRAYRSSSNSVGISSLVKEKWRWLRRTGATSISGSMIRTLPGLRGLSHRLATSGSPTVADKPTRRGRMFVHILRCAATGFLIALPGRIPERSELRPQRYIEVAQTNREGDLFYWWTGFQWTPVWFAERLRGVRSNPISDCFPHRRAIDEWECLRLGIRAQVFWIDH